MKSLGIIALILFGGATLARASAINDMDFYRFSRGIVASDEAAPLIQREPCVKAAVASGINALIQEAYKNRVAVPDIFSIDSVDFLETTNVVALTVNGTPLSVGIVPQGDHCLAFEAGRK